MERLNGALTFLNEYSDREAQHLDFVELSARGSTFNQWKMMGTLLWIHGKRACFAEISAVLANRIFRSGLRKDRTVVRWLSSVLDFWILNMRQFHNHRRHQAYARGWHCLNGMLLF